jgi:DNA-binding CsgD family transcriptional regulator
VADPHPGAGQADGQDPRHRDLASGGAGSLVERVFQARLNSAGTPASPRSPAQQPWLSALAGGAEQRLSRVAALGQTAQMALRLGQASECLAALAQQREAAGDDQVAQVWALTSSSACRAAFGQLAQARADLAEAKQACHYAAPLLAEPFWRFTEIVCNWLAGNWAVGQAEAAALDASKVSPITPALADIVAALRTEMLRGIGQRRESRQLADKLGAAVPNEISAWALAGQDTEEGQFADAVRRLAGVPALGMRGLTSPVLSLVLHRLAEAAFSCRDQAALAAAAADLARLDPAAPLTAILAGLAQSYATRDPGPARRAQQCADAEGAGMLAAEALTVRGRIGDDPARTLGAAYTAWQRFGVPGKARAVGALMHAAGLAVPATADQRASRREAEGPEMLTARERGVARLVHEGLTNQQIARTMDISIKTVEAYLTRLYRKTSCSSRVELAVAVTERRVQTGD